MRNEDIEQLLPLPKSSRRKTWIITVSTLVMAWMTILLIVLTGQVSGAGAIGIGMIALIATTLSSWSLGGAWDFKIFKETFSIRADLIAAQTAAAPPAAATPATPEQKKADEAIPPAGPVQEIPDAGTA